MNLRGHIAGGLLGGYGRWKDRMRIDEYVALVIAGRLVDPTLSVQLSLARAAGSLAGARERPVR